MKIIKQSKDLEGFMSPLIKTRTKLKEQARALDRQQKDLVDHISQIDSEIANKLRGENIEEFEGLGVKAKFHSNLSIKIIDNEKFFNWVIKNKAFDFLRANSLKNSIAEKFIDKNKEMIDGVSVSTYIKFKIC